MTVASGFSRKTSAIIPNGARIACHFDMHPYPKHLDGFDYVGCHRYFLTLCTNERRALFTSAEHVAFVEQPFLRTARECDIADLAHCFMPDHLHAVLEGRAQDADFRSFVSRMKQHTGFHFKKQFGERLWRRYVHEHVIRSDEVTGNVIRYVLENPVRAGLVTDLRLYPFIGSSEYTLEQLLEFCVDPPESGRSSG